MKDRPLSLDTSSSKSDLREIWEITRRILRVFVVLYFAWLFAVIFLKALNAAAIFYEQKRQQHIRNRNRERGFLGKISYGYWTGFFWCCQLPVLFVLRFRDYVNGEVAERRAWDQRRQGNITSADLEITSRYQEDFSTWKKKNPMGPMMNRLGWVSGSFTGFFALIVIVILDLLMEGQGQKSDLLVISILAFFSYAITWVAFRLRDRNGKMPKISRWRRYT